MVEPRRNLAFSRALRLTKAREFQQAFAARRRLTGRLTTLAVRENGLEIPRLGLAISRKQLRKAVDRGRLKRIIRDSFRHHQALLEGFDVVVMARGSARGATPAAVRADLERHWQRLAGMPPGRSTSRQRVETPCR